jgi:hypothetical protein
VIERKRITNRNYSVDSPGRKRVDESEKVFGFESKDCQSLLLVRQGAPEVAECVEPRLEEKAVSAVQFARPS